MLLEQDFLELDIITTDKNTIFHYLENIVGMDGFNNVFESLSKKSSPELINVYNNSGYTSLHKIFEKLISSIPSLKNEFIQKHLEELSLKKQEKARSSGGSKQIEQESQPFEFKQPNTKFGSQGFYQTKKKFTAHSRPRPAYNTYKRKYDSKDEDDEDDYEEEDEMNENNGLQFSEYSSTVNSTERDQIMKDAEVYIKELIEDFLEFLRMIKNKGADINLQIKNPKKVKKDQDDKEKIDDEDDEDYDYDIFTYFQVLQDIITERVESKIDVPQKVFIQKNVGYSLLHIACSANYLDIIKFLLEEYKIKINQTSVYGESELMKFISDNGSTETSFN